jgi:hypothetical protein
MKRDDLTALRAEYRTLRASCTRHTAERFDEVARGIAYELADGEEVTPAMWVVVAGQDYA